MSSENHFDVIIIGSGAGGGTLAHRLAPSEVPGFWRSVLAGERAPRVNALSAISAARSVRCVSRTFRYVVRPYLRCGSGAAVALVCCSARFRRSFVSIL